MAGISEDEVHTEFLKHLINNSVGASGLGKKLVLHLQEIRDKATSRNAAEVIQKQLKLSPELCDVADFRAEQAARAVTDQIRDMEKKPDRDPNRRVHLRQLQEEKSRLVKSSALLRSRLDLRDWGWDRFENVLLQLGVVAWMSCIYWYLAPRTGKSLNEFHGRVDRILRRQGYDPKTERINLMRLWLTTANWHPSDLVKNNAAGQAEINELEKTFSTMALSTTGNEGIGSSIPAEQRSVGGSSSSSAHFGTTGTAGSSQPGLGSSSKTAQSTSTTSGSSGTVPVLKLGEYSYGGSSGSSGGPGTTNRQHYPFAALTELWCQSPAERQMVARIALLAAPGVAPTSEELQQGTDLHRLPQSGGPATNARAGRKYTESDDNIAESAGTGAASSAGAARGGGATTTTSASETEPKGGSLKRGRVSPDTGLSKKAGGGATASDGSAELRNRIKLFLHWLLRDSLLTNACCRCFCCLLQIATVPEILAVYNHPAEDLWDFFRTFLYLNALEKVGVGHIDLQTFRETDKEGLARSYWRQQHKDPLLVAVITGLVLDFKVHDARFLAQIFLRLLHLHMHSFLRDALQHVHNSGFLAELPFDQELAASFQTILLTHPQEQLANAANRFCKTMEESINSASSRSGSSGRKEEGSELESCIEWMEAVPGLLRRSPYVTHLSVLETAKRLIEVTRRLMLVRSTAMSGGFKPAKAGRSTGDYTQRRATSSVTGGSSYPKLTEILFDTGADESNATSEQEGKREGEDSSQFFRRVAVVAFELAFCTPDCTKFLSEHVTSAQGSAILVPLCLSLPAPPAYRPLLFKAVLEQKLAKDLRALEPSRAENADTQSQASVFTELVHFAVRESLIKDLLDAAIEQGLLGEAVNLVFLYAKEHGIFHIWNDESEGREQMSLASEYLRNLLSEYEKAEDSASREFTKLCRLKS
ncbi:unnamed protein product [Amoebophrya sp. A25]|nr:unnamed protein product [Amoebophrya sp. A25]|eukprot:GSA25T00022190001.1